MSGAVRGTLALALLAAAGPARGYVRTNTCPDDAGAGYALYLDPPALAYKLSDLHVPAGCAGDLATLRTLVNASVATWASAGSPSVCTGLSVSYAGDAHAAQAVGVVDGQNLVVFRTGACAVVAAGQPCLTQGGCSNLYNCWEDATSLGVATLALTWVSYDTGSGQIHDADMELQDWNGDAGSPAGHYFTCASSGGRCQAPPYGRTGCVEWDVGSVVTHEAGHMIGLDHVTGVNAVMNPTLSPGTLTKRALQPDDVAGACAVYPVGQGAVRQKLAGWCVPPARKGCGCEGGAAGALGWLALVPLLLRRPGRGHRPTRR